MSRPNRIWVHEDFKKAVKKAATDQEKSVLDFTKDLADEIDRLRRRPRAFK